VEELMSKNRDRGKRFEKKIAERLGGRRLGVLGGEDVLHPIYSIECKSREKLPKWFESFWKQTMDNCEEYKVPLLVIHLLNQRHDEDWVVMKLSDFEQLCTTKPTSKRVA